MLKVKLIYSWFAFYKSTNQLIKNFSNLFHLPKVGVAYFASANSSLALFNFELNVKFYNFNFNFFYENTINCLVCFSFYDINCSK